MPVLAKIAKAQTVHWLVALAVAAFIVCTYFALGWHVAFPESGDALRQIGATVAGIVGAFAGFLLTAVALIFALPDRPVLRDMRYSGHFLDLCAWMLSAVVACLLATGLALVLAMVVDGSGWPLALVLGALFLVAYFVLHALLRLALTIVNVAWDSK